jgi:hypothetical protein
LTTDNCWRCNLVTSDHALEIMRIFFYF